MRADTHKRELATVLCFLATLVVVPLTQTCRELAHGERVQFTDVFRQPLTAANLRQYEDILKEKSWFQQTLRPVVQRALFQSLRDTGAKAILGIGNWLFYRPDVRYLVEPNRAEARLGRGVWATPASGGTPRESVVRAVVRFREQLQERGIHLLVVPIPGKPSIYPDRLTPRAARDSGPRWSPTVEVLQALKAQGIETVDLFTVFREARAGADPSNEQEPLYLAQDTHWTPAGVESAARAIATRLQTLNWTQPGTKEFTTSQVRVKRWGDVLEMTQIPGLHGVIGLEEVACQQVRDPVLGLLVPGNSDRPGAYKHPGQKTPILVLGDSFCRIYQFHEPQSLGERIEPSDAGAVEVGTRQSTKRLLPGSAGLVSRLAFHLKTPVDAIVSDGGASTDVRRKLSTHAEILEGKKVVIWEFVERDIGLGSQGWEEAPLPPRLDS